LWVVHLYALLEILFHSYLGSMQLSLHSVNLKKSNSYFLFACYIPLHMSEGACP
jgi:hypothetical protein